MLQSFPYPLDHQRNTTTEDRAEIGNRIENLNRMKIYFKGLRVEEKKLFGFQMMETGQIGRAHV